jgi:hypothetical protein
MLSPRVCLLIHNPVIKAEGGRKLHQVLGWNDPDELTAAFIDDIRQVSHGYVSYRVVDRVEIDGFPVKLDGRRYTGDSYLRAWRSRSGFHMPDTANYAELLREADFPRKLAADQVDELWMFAFPYGGYFESCMGGPGAIWCNGDIIPGTAGMAKRFVAMGFNYERGVGEMLESYGHRVENIMEHVFRDIPDSPPVRQPSPVVGGLRGMLSAIDHLFGGGDQPEPGAAPEPPSLSDNLWRAFIRYDKTHPGAASCGNVHFAPNSTRDYEWGNRQRVLTSADDWLNYPNFTGETSVQDCAAWGHGDIRAHHQWWMRRFPHVEGQTPTGKPHNWWKPIAGLEF